MGTGGLVFRRIRASAFAEPTGFAWVEQAKLAASGFPASRKQVGWLVARGVNSILTLTPNSIPQAWVEGFGLTQGHVPMEDHGVPSFDALDRSVSFIHQQVVAGKTVLVHCLAGEGRTGCALGAYLIADEHLSAPGALEKLRRVKPQFVEPSQEGALAAFAARVKA